VGAAGYAVRRCSHWCREGSERQSTYSTDGQCMSCSVVVQCLVAVSCNDEGSAVLYRTLSWTALRSNLVQFGADSTVVECSPVACGRTLTRSPAARAAMRLNSPAMTAPVECGQGVHESVWNTPRTREWGKCGESCRLGQTVGETGELVAQCTRGSEV
jgi:hypothetical protein